MILIFSFLLAAPVLWQDPGQVEAVDFSRPAGGGTCPTGPFTFVEEIAAGNTAKVLVKDPSGILWQVKGGPEARADSFSTRFISALGYYGETICFLAQGKIEALNTTLKRAAGFIQPDGTFTWAGFERRDPSMKFLAEVSWTWVDNPFRGSRELQGLKILMMLLSNWDNKDARNTWNGSNTGVLQGTQGQIFFVTDWGQSLGAWAGFRNGEPWNCAKFRTQSRDFVHVMDGNSVRFSYRGQHTYGFADSITVEDVTWLMKYLGRITDAQIHLGLAASGATREEEACFAESIRSRIEQLRNASGTGGAKAALR